MFTRFGFIHNIWLWLWLLSNWTLCVCAHVEHAEGTIRMPQISEANINYFTHYITCMHACTGSNISIKLRYAYAHDVCICIHICFPKSKHTKWIASSHFTMDSLPRWENTGCFNLNRKRNPLNGNPSVDFGHFKHYPILLKTSVGATHEFDRSLYVILHRILKAFLIFYMWIECVYNLEPN